MHALKFLHITAVTLSLCGFALRGLAMLARSSLLEHRAVRVVPHIVDTVLLLSGVALAVSWHIDPMEQPWLAAKLLALPVYVVLGAMALKRARSYRARVVCLLLALMTAAYIVGAALQHSPWSWMGAVLL